VNDFRVGEPPTPMAVLKHRLDGTRFLAPDIALAASSECCVEGIPAKHRCSSRDVCTKSKLSAVQDFHGVVTEPPFTIDDRDHRPRLYTPLRWRGFEADVDASSPEGCICISN